VNKASLIVIAVILAAGSAHAQQPAPNAAADAALSEGRRLYDLQEWDQAILKFKEAYRLRADAPSLFNIAQSYRLKGDCANAASFYKTFKRNFPKEKNIEKVEKFIAEMEACAAGKTTAVKTDPVKTDPVKTDPVKPVKTDPVKTDPVKTDPVKTDPVKTDPVNTDPVKTDPVDTDPSGGSVTTDPETPSRGGGGMKIAGIAVGGIGLVAVGAGVAFGLRASSAASDAEKLAPGSVWKPDIETRGEKAAKNAKIFMVVGGAAVVTGPVLYFLGAKKSAESSSVSVIPTRDGATVSWASEF
jgi:hypothetical protein